MADKKIKILFIHHSAGWGGAAGCMINLIKSLDFLKYESEVLLLKYSEVADKLAENNIHFTVARSEFFKKYYHFLAHSEAGYIKWYQIRKVLISGISWLLSRFIFARAELARHDFDIVHLNSSVLTDWLAPAKRRSKVIIHIREPFRKGKLDLLHPIIKSIIKRNADQIIAISMDNAMRIDIPERTQIIYDFCEIPDKLPPEISYSSKKVLYLGGSSGSKGFYTLVNALDYLDEDVIVFFCGKYVTNNNPKNIIQLFRFLFSNDKKRIAAILKIKSRTNTVLSGLIYNVQDYLNEVCCLVSPFSVPHFSFPVIEAYMQRKPAIGSDVEGMDEIILHEKNGLIIPKNNPKALAYAINALTADSKKAKEYGENGYKNAVQKFTPRNIKQFENIYDRLFNNDLGIN